MTNIARRWTLITLCLCGAAPAVQADVLMIARVQEADSPPRAAFIWAGPQHYRYDDGKQALIADFGAQTLIQIDHDAAARRALAWRPATKPVGEQATPVLLDDNASVGQWPTRRYELRWAEYGITSIVDVTTPANADVADFKRAVARLGGLTGTGWMNALSALPGVPVRIETTVQTANGPRTVVREIVNILNRPAPVATYLAPSRYTQIGIRR